MLLIRNRYYCFTNYGFSDLYGVSGKYLKNLIEEPVRQIVENEDYRKSVPQLKYAEPDPTEVPHDQGDPGSGSRPSEAAHDYASAPTSAPKVFGPGGVQYDPPKPDGPMEKPNVDLRPRSGSVGASAKPKAQPAAPKSQPQSPAPKPMPSSGLLLDDHLHHLYQPGDKMRVELKARTQLILVPQMSLHNLHKLQLILSQPIKWGGNETTGIRAVVEEGPEEAEVVQDVPTEIGNTFPENYIIAEKTREPGVA